MKPALALLPSPLVGPAVWQPVADLLTASGWEVVDLPWSTTAPRTPVDQVSRYLADLPADRPLVVVPHSNAGLFVPAIAAARQVEAMVFVDAGVPPRGGPYRLAPREFYEFLEGRVDADGLLPAWTQWWGDEVAGLFPSADSRARVEREQRRLPLGYFAGSMTAQTGWDERAAAYLAFGDTYAEERADAASRGWAVTTLPGHHLHMLVDPEQVAATIERLLSDL